MDSLAEGLTTYDYDEESQIEGAIHSGAANESYSYDDNGNRNSTGYGTVEDNRISTSPDGRYEYDSEGNVTLFTDDATFEWHYKWDHRNRLVEAKETWTTPDQVIAYTYDAFNLLVERDDSAANETQNWVFADGINPEVQFNTHASGPDSRQLYLWSNAVDELLAAEEIQSSSSVETLWALNDHLGTIRDIAARDDMSGVTTVENHRRYSAFGELVSETDASVELVFGYTGRLLDEETGLQNNLNRWYDSRIGRWISQDPIGFAGGDANLYR